MTMDYDIKELVQIVGKLAEKYTSFESTSVSYEKAEQLMEAVLYCINETEIFVDNAVISKEGLSAQQAYEIGSGYVEQKVKMALDMYNKILPRFKYYKNRCLHDTFIKGLPEFFKWYDIKFEPQSTILTLDYPVLTNISQYTGVDKIYEFIKCIYLEQKFLSMFPEEYILKILYKCNKRYVEAIDNICEIIFTDVICHILTGKSLSEPDFKENGYLCMQKIFIQFEIADINMRIKTALKVFIKQYYDNDNELLEYLAGSIENIVVRLKNASDNDALRCSH